jgi:flagellar biosynthesis protein FliR
MFQLPQFISLGDFTLFTLVLGRLAGIFSALPLFGGSRVPLKIRVVAILAMTMTCFPILHLKAGGLPGDILSLFILIIAEVMIGVTLGFVAKAVFGAVEFCGQLVGMQMGFSMSTMFDPTMGQIPLMSLFQSLLAMLLFLSLGAHHMFIRAMVDSYALIPIGGWHMSSSLITFLTTVTTGVFILGVKLAAPVMVALLATTVILGVMARSFPQMNVFIISMPVNIGVGFVILGLSLLVFLKTLQLSFGGMATQIKILFRLLS